MIVGMETHEANLFRPTSRQRTAMADSEAQFSATPTTANVLLMLEHITSGRSQREFGQTVEADYRGTVDEGYDVQVNDVLVVTYGPFGVGQALKVLDMRAAPQLESRVLALKVTNERP